MNGNSVIALGLLGPNASVQRFCVRLAPLSSPWDQAPPSSAYFDASSATPQAIGGTVGPLVVVGGAVVVAVVDVSVVWPAGSSAAPVAAKNPAARSAQRQSPPNTLTF